MAGDLALDAAGAEQIFSQAHVDITDEQAAAVTARTEGWPAGLYLAAVIARTAAAMRWRSPATIGTWPTTCTASR